MYVYAHVFMLVLEIVYVCIDMCLCSVSVYVSANLLQIVAIASKV